MPARTVIPRRTEPALADVGESWIVVNTHPHKERVAIENLEQQQYQVYCPLVRMRIRHARKTVEVLRPLFPCYLFVSVDCARERWRAILSTRGVRSIVCDGERPCKIRQHVIESLRAREIRGAIVRPASPYKIGQEVRIVGGAFDNLVARVVSLDDDDRLVVLLDLLSQAVKTHVTMPHIRPV